MRSNKIIHLITTIEMGGEETIISFSTKTD